MIPSMENSRKSIKQSKNRSISLRSSVAKTIQVILTIESNIVYENFRRVSGRTKQDTSIFNALSQKINMIKHNALYGEIIKKEFYPIEYIKSYDITNLFKIELPEFWRMLYTIIDSEEGKEILIIDIIDHDKYNKKFGWKGK